MPAPWPAGFTRVPDEDWTRAPVESLALKYDAVERHGWYDNLDPTVDDLAAWLTEGRIAIDYSGGTGILIDRLLRRLPERDFGIVNVDSSPKFLRLSHEKLREDPRVAFRLIRYLKEERRLQFVDEVLGEPLLRRGVDALVSTNAIHLYYDLTDTLRSWRRVLRPGGRVFVQSGNIRTQEADGRHRWIIDDTVEAIHERAIRIVRERDEFARHRPVLDDAGRMAKYGALRQKFFLPPRPLAHYEEALRDAGFRVLDVRTRGIQAKTQEWLDFLLVYHEGVLGWVGGSERIEGAPASADDVAARQRLMRLALEDIMGQRDVFEATWTYLTCEPA